MGAAWRAVCGGPAGAPPRPRCAYASTGHRRETVRTTASADFTVLHHGRPRGLRCFLLFGVLQALVDRLDEHVRRPRLVLAEPAVPVFRRTRRLDLLERASFLHQILDA